MEETASISAAKLQYRDKPFLLNKSELKVFKRLNEAAPALLVFAQVSMTQLFQINRLKKGGTNPLGEIGRKTVDFLLCRANDSSIVLAIQLLGPKNHEDKQKAKDDKKRMVLEEAGIPLLALSAAEIPDVVGMRRLLAPHIIERKKYEAGRGR